MTLRLLCSALICEGYARRERRNRSRRNARSNGTAREERKRTQNSWATLFDFGQLNERAEFELTISFKHPVSISFCRFSTKLMIS